MIKTEWNANNKGLGITPDLLDPTDFRCSAVFNCLALEPQSPVTLALGNTYQASSENSCGNALSCKSGTSTGITIGTVSTWGTQLGLQVKIGFLTLTSVATYTKS